MSNDTKKSRNNPPVARLRVGQLNASIWERQTAKGTFYSVTVERRYRDAEGNWKSTQGYSVDDLPVLVELAKDARSRMLELQRHAY